MSTDGEQVFADSDTRDCWCQQWPIAAGACSGATGAECLDMCVTGNMRDGESYCSTNSCGAMARPSIRSGVPRPARLSLSYQANILPVQCSESSCSGFAAMFELPYLFAKDDQRLATPRTLNGTHPQTYKARAIGSTAFSNSVRCSRMALVMLGAEATDSMHEADDRLGTASERGYAVQRSAVQSEIAVGRVTCTSDPSSVNGRPNDRLAQLPRVSIVCS